LYLPKSVMGNFILNVLFTGCKFYNCFVVILRGWNEKRGSKWIAPTILIEKDSILNFGKFSPLKRATD
jgi:hypothetical protein